MYMDAYSTAIGNAMGVDIPGIGGLFNFFSGR